MSQNSINIDKLNSLVSEISLVKTVNKDMYNDQFNLHLTSLLDFVKFSTDEDKKKFKFTENKYLGLEQRVLEVHDDSYDDTVWDLIDEGRYLYKRKIQSLLGHEGSSEFMKPFVLFTTDIFENWLTFKLLNHEKQNPWGYILETITSSGCLLYISSDRYKLDSYKKDIYKNVDEECYGNLGIVAKPNTGRGKSSGFVVDNRYSTQVLVRDFLMIAAKGRENAKPIDKIVDFIQRKSNRRIHISDLRRNVLLPLKRKSLIGSSSNGFFYINAIEDVVSTYKHHLNSLKGIQITLDNCKNKAKELGYDDIDSLLNSY